MKKSIFSLLILSAITVFAIAFSFGSSPADNEGCNCTGSPVTIIGCYPLFCSVPSNIHMELVDEDCGIVLGTCDIPSGSASLCCKLTTSGCSNHHFHINYSFGGGSVCSTATFVPSSNPFSVNIGCSCP